MKGFIGTLIFFINMFYLDRRDLVKPLPNDCAQGIKYLYWEDLCELILDVARSKNWNGTPIYDALVRKGITRWALFSVLQRFSKLNSDDKSLGFHKLNEYMISNYPDWSSRFEPKDEAKELYTL